MPKLNPTRLIAIILVIATIAGLTLAAVDSDSLARMTPGIFAPSDGIGKTDPLASTPDYQPLGTLARGESNILAPTATVTTNGGSGLAGTYPDLASAITALNAATITSPVVISVSGTETAPAGGYSITAQGSAANTITIDGGNSTTITAFTPQTSGNLNDSIFKIIGGDYISLQGFTMQENAANTTTTTASNNMTEWGVALLYQSTTNGSQNNTLQNNIISLNRTYLNTFGIYSNTRHSSTAVATSAEVTAASGSNSNNKVYGNQISNVNYGIVFIGAGTTIAAIDSGNDIGGVAIGTGNTITNWGGGAAPTGYVSLTGSNYCIFDNQQINDNVSFNTITSGSLAQAVTTGGILKNYSIASPTGGIITTTITNNTVQVTNNPSAATTGAIIGINNQGLTPLLSTATMSLNNNTVQNSVLGGSTSTTNALTGITNLSLPGTLNMNNNNVINNSITATTATSGLVNGLSNSGAAGTVNMNGNVVRGWGSTATSGQVQGITNSGAVVTALNINNNQLGNGSGGFLTTSTATSGSLFGISTSGGASTCALSVTGNDIRGITYNTAASAAQNYYQNTAATLSQNISNNTFTNLNVNTTGSVTFISNNVSVPATGTQNVNSNSIVTGFNKAGAGGTITLYTTNASSVAGAVVNNNSNNFSNITVTGATTIAGWSNTDGGSPTKTYQNNTFSNWTGGTSSITALNVNFGFQNVTGNTISNITGQGAISGIVRGSSGSATSESISNNIISGLSSTGTGGAVVGLSDAATSVTTMSIASNAISGLSSTGASVTSTGIQITGGATVNVSGNTINTISGSGATSPVVNGLSVSSGTNVNISKNKIFDISESGAISTTSPAVNGILLSGGTTVSAFNNLLGDLRAPAASLSDAIRGISVTSSTTSTSYNLYFNSVYLNASSIGATFGTSGIFHAGSATATTAKLDLRNNLIVNTSAPGGTGGNTVALRRSGGGISGTLSNYASTSNNNLFYAGSPAANRLIYFDGTDSAQSMSAYKGGVFAAGTIAPRDNVSFSENPNFLSTSGSNANFLKINTTIATQLESGAVNISGITDDFEGDIRQGNAGYGGTGTAPDVGADEFNGILADLTGPAITYTLLGNGAAGASRAFGNVTITDATGVNGTAGTRPRVYYRKTCDPSTTFNDNTNTTAGWKFVEASGATSPFSFTIDYSLFGSFGACSGAGVAVGDTVQYFVVAQDTVGTPNVSINAGTFASQPSSVALTSAAFPIGGSVNSYNIVAALNGTKTVCASGCDYTGLTTAGGVFADINGRFLSANLEIQIAGDLTSETGAVALNAPVEEPVGSNFNIKIYPTGAARTISGSSAAGLIKLNGTDRVTFDGSVGGLGADRSLTIVNNNTGTSSAVIWLASASAADGATGNTIKNCVIRGNASTTTLGGIVSSSGTTMGGVAEAANSGNSYLNNAISTSVYGIALVGPTGNESGNTVSGNSVGSATTANKIGLNGIAVFQQANGAVSGNTVFGVTTSSSSRVSGIRVSGGASGEVVSNNIVQDVKNTNSTGFGANGIELFSSNTAANVTVSNNVITDVTGAGFSSGVGPDDNGYGILVNTGGGYKIYFNSVNLTTNQTTGVSAAININSTITTAGTLDIRNNVFATAQTTNTRYGIYSTAANTVFGTIDYNDYFAVTGGNPGFIGSARTDLAGIQAGFGQNTHSLVSNPQFNSATNLQPQVGSPVLGAGVAGTGVLADILGNTRSTGVAPAGPSIGAYENGTDTAPPTITYTALGNTTDGSSRVLGVTITDGTGVASGAVAPRVYFKKNAGGYASTQCTGSSPNYSCTIDYSGGVGAPAVGDTISYFVTAQDTLGNVGANPSAGFAATDVNTVTTPPTSPNTYTILLAVGGTYSVNAGGGGAATSLTNAGGIFSIINGGVATSNIIITIDSDLTAETGTVALNAVASPYTVTIQPGGGVARTISGSASTSLIRLDGGSRVTVNGSLTGTGNDKSLFISNTSTSGATIHLLNNAANNTFKNLDIKGVSTSTSNGIVYLGTTASGTVGNNNNTFQSNDIHSGATSAAYGFYNSGSSFAKNTNTFVQNNRIFDFATNGIRDDGNSVGAGYRSNEIFEQATQTSTTLVGFRPSSTSIDGFTFDKNFIHDLNTSGTSASVFGIHLFDTSTAATSLISNNMINLGTASATTLRGIYDQTATGEKYNVFYNSIYLSGTVTGASNSEAYYWSIASTTNASGNILFNDRTGGTGKHYAYRLNSTIANLTSNYNDIFVNGGTASVFGNDGTADRADLTAWQTALSKDANSISANPAFVSSSNLHITYGSPAKNTGAAFGGIADDYDGDSRPLDGGYDIGADEYKDTTLPVINLNLAAPGTPTDPTTSTSATFTFSATDSITNAPAAVAGFECALDTPTFTSCASPQSYGPGLSVGSHTFKVHAIDASNNVSTDATFTWTINAPNAAPSISTTTGLARQRGSAAVNSQVATVNDTEDGPNALVVNAQGVPSDVTINTIVNSGGNVTANLAAGCSAFVGSNQIVLRVTDSGAAFTDGNLNFTVTANTPPTVSYGNVSVNQGAGTNNSPSSATDNGSIASYAIQGQGTYTGGISINSSTGQVTFTGAAPAGTHTITVRSTDNCGDFTDSSFTITVAAPDYSVSTAGNVVTVTDLSGNTDTLNVTEPGAGQIKFAAAGRTFSVDGGAFITGDSGNIPLASVTQITVNAQAGDDTISVGGFTSSLPSLTLNGGTGNDAIRFNGNITFASGASLDADMQNDDANPGSDDFIQFVSGQLTLSGSGSATFKCTKFISMASGTKVQTVDGNITMEANQQASPTVTGTIGIDVNGGTIQSTGAGIVTVKGRGGNSAGISVTNNGLIKGGSTAGVTTTIVNGTGGSQASNMHGIQAATSFITSFGGNVSVTGQGGSAGSTNIGIILFPGAPLGGQISSGGNGNVTVQGTGGSGAGSDGIRIDGSGSGISALGSGTISVTGTAGATSGPGISISRQGSVQSMTGTITLTGTGTGGGNGIQMLNGNTNVATGGNVTINLIADTMDIAAAQSISANSGIVNIRQNTNGRPISLGGADGPTQLGLTDAELDRVTAGTLNIGDSNTSNTQVDGVITQTKTTNLKSPVFTTVFSAGSLGIFGTLTSGLNVNNGGTVAPGASPGIINTGSDFNMGSGANLAIEIGGTTPGNGAGFHDQVNVTGAVNLDGNLSVSSFGGFTPVFGQSYTIINNDGAEAVSGTFTGLPEGTSVPIGGTGRSAKISYVGGSGNDVVLTVDAIPGTMQFSSATYSVGEAGPNATLTVTRTGGSDGPISATYTLGGGSATGGTCGGGADYDNTGGSVSFAAGDVANKTITVPICDDSVYEAAETFNATLVGSNLGSPSVASVTINDNDTAPTFAVNDVAVNEGDSGLTNLTFTITRTGATAFNSTVNFHTADGTATVANNDYQPIIAGSAPSGVSCSASCVTFLPGDLTKQVTVKVVGDTNIEPDENFHLLLDSVTNGTISDGDGLGTITNDDAVPVTQFSSSTYIDDESQDVVFTITRTGNTSVASTVLFSTTGGGTATGGASCAPGVDYVTITNQLVSFSSGQASQNVAVTTCGDNTIEPPDTFNAALSSPSSSVLGSPSTAQATIRDTASRYTNHNFIDMTLGGNGSLYPSPIVVSGAPTVNGTMRVTLYDVSHIFPDNIDVLLVDPAGRTYVLMGDAGGPTPIDPSGAVTLTFDDFASQLLPDSTPLATGKYKPTTWESPVSPFAFPAPAGPYNEPGSSLTRPPGATFQSTFGGFNPNGTWNLYVRDDAGTPLTAPNTATGSISGGWGIQFFAPTAAGVQVSGRVTNAAGTGIRNARVVMTDQNGVARTVITNAFGYYTFDDVTAGQAYIVGVEVRNMTFATRLVQVFDTLTDVDFSPQ